ncbi:transposable element Tc1 transposase [Trichonephila clavipes]|uniref:Transposable element Tc1 transposase n=1 Tax=Trichonephila clavipes TaxID=2585209 RepID=A0A8X6VAY7_TRICX|nr:transposable element Tc1 transposase [Trichonephila clavipes]
MMMIHDGCIHVRHYASVRCLPECVFKRYTCLTSGAMVWDAISYHGRSNLLRIEGNLICNRFISEVLQCEVALLLQGISGAVFQQDNARLHVANTFRDFLSSHHMQLLPWPAQFPDMLPIEHVWILLVGVSFVIRVLQLQKTNFCYAYKQYGVLLHKQTFKICLT